MLKKKLELGATLTELAPSFFLHKRALAPLTEVSERAYPETAMIAHFIIYVRDQEQSTQFYTTVLGQKPQLHVS